MKCPSCGKWNRASMPRCFHCGEPLDQDLLLHDVDLSSWRAEMDDYEKPKVYVRVDESGAYDEVPDPRDALASEMVDLKVRKRQGEMQQHRLRQSAAQRGLAPSGRTVRTTSNRGSFFSVYDDPDTTLRPVDPLLVEEGDVEEGAQIVYTERYRSPGSASSKKTKRTMPQNYGQGITQRVVSVGSQVDEPQVYDGYQDTSAYISAYSRPDEFEHSMRMRNTDTWKPRRFGARRLMQVFLVAATLVVIGWLGWAVVLPILQGEGNDASAEVTVTPTIRDDLAAHTVTIPGEEGQRITIRELRASAIVTGGVAVFDIPDHTWYDDFEEYLQDTMSVTLTPYVMTDTGKQIPMSPIHYEIDIPLSPIELATPDNLYKVVSTAMYNIVFYVREGSAVSINGEDYSDLVNTEGGKVSYNATVQPIGENYISITVRSQYCRENSMTITLFREKQDIPLDLSSDIQSRSIDQTLTIRATTLPGAVVKVLSPHSDLDITNTDSNGDFTFKAIFDKIGDNTIRITADYPNKRTTTVEHVIYYVPSIDIYSRKARDATAEYSDLVSNIERHKKNSQIYVCKGSITSIETTKPQRAYINVGTEENPKLVYVENSSRTEWVEGEYYRLYGDAYGLYDRNPWLIVRYTYAKDEY